MILHHASVLFRRLTSQMICHPGFVLIAYFFLLSWNSTIIIRKTHFKVNIVELHEIVFLIIHIINSWNTYKEFHEGGRYMNINDAIIRRIEETCKEKDINVCEAALGGGKSPSAIYDLIKDRTKYSKVSTIKAFCQGAGITLSEFFDREYFNDFEE